MVGLVEFLQDSKNNDIKSNINESGLGISLTIIGGIIGYKFLKVLLSGLIATGAGVVAKNQLKELNNIQSEMASLLEKYPDVKKHMLNDNGYKRILKSNGGKSDGFYLSETGAFLDRDIANFSNEDKTRFKQLFDRVVELREGILQYIESSNL